MAFAERLATYETPVHLATSGWQEFYPFVRSFPPVDQWEIYYGYETAYLAHKDQTRQSGEPYFTHSLATAQILLAAGIRDADIIVAAFLHDVVEDTEYLDKGPITQFGEVRADFERIEGAFNNKVMEMMHDLTSPGDDELYLARLDVALPESILIKIADRIHNVRTLGSMPRDKQEKKIEETKRKYMPIFRRVLLEYPKEGKILLNWLEEAIMKWERAH